MNVLTKWSNRILLLLCAALYFFAGTYMVQAAGPMDQGYGWSTSYFQVIGDDFSCAADEVRYDVEYVDAQTDIPVNAPALLALFDKDTGNSVTFEFSTNGSVGSVCFNPDDHEISVSIDETTSYYSYWSMYREDNPGDIPRQKHITGKVWLQSKAAPIADYEHTFPSVGTDEILSSSPDFEATVNQLPNLLGASSLTEATVFVYDLISLSLVETYTTSISGGTGLKDLGTVSLQDGRYSWGFYLSMDANHDAGSLLGLSGQPNSSFSGLSGNFRIDTTDPTFSTRSHSPASPNESQDVNLQITARDPASNGYYSGIREVRVYFDGSLVRTCTQNNTEVQNVGCNVNLGAQTTGSYSYYAETEDHAGNVFVSPTNNISVVDFFNSQGTINGTTCSVATGNSTCQIDINWSTNEFIGTPNVRNQSTNALISTSPSGVQSVNIGPSDDIFELTDTGAGTIFTGDTYNANVGCADGSAYWNGTICALQPAGSINGTTCGIATGASSCNIDVTWTTSNFTGTPNVTRDFSNTVISTSVTGSQNVSVTPNDDVFTLTDTGAGTIFTGASYNANVGCAVVGDVWNGSICQPQPTGSITGAFCQVPVDGTDCLIDLDWTSTNFFGTTEVRQGATVLSTSPSATNFTVPVDPDNNLFTLNDTGGGSPFPGTSFIATVTCAPGSLWDGSTCSPAAYDSFVAQQVELSCAPDEFFDDINVVCVKIPTASITGTTCQIAPGASTCGITLDWLHNDPVGSTVVERGVGVVQYGTLTATGFGVTVGPSSDVFTISDDGYQSGTTLASFDANVGCTAGYFWNGSLCQAEPVGSISGTSCTVDTGNSTCDVLLSWSATNFFGTPEVRRMSPYYAPLSTALSGTDVAFPTNPDNDRFRIIDLGAGTIFPGDTYDANVTCTDVDSAWNGTICIKIPQGTLGGTTCTVPTGDSSCQINLNWTTSDFVGPPRVERSDGSFISNAASDSILISVSPSQDNFTLSDTGAGTLFPGTTYNANVTCADFGSVWNGSSCIPEPIGNLNFSSGCQIITGESTCDAAITWSTTNFVGAPEVRQGFTTLSNALSASNFPVTLTFGANQVRLDDTGAGTTFTGVVRNYNVTCADADDAWNGSVCAPDLQSGFSVSGQGQQTGCPPGQFLSIQTGACEFPPNITQGANETWTRYDRPANIRFQVQAPYEVACTIDDGGGTSQNVTHNSGAGTDSNTIPYQLLSRSLTSTQLVTVSCLAAGMVDPVTGELRVNVIPNAEEI